MTALLERALASGLEVRVWYVGLDSPERHLARVRGRRRPRRPRHPRGHGAAAVSHEPAESRGLAARLTELRVYDNSAEADPAAGAAPEPRLLLHTRGGRLVASCPLPTTPAWAKPIMAAALKASSA